MTLLRRLKSLDQFSIHYSLSFIRFLEKDINFILSITLLKFFREINKNRLKNVLLKSIGSVFVWVEIQKMISFSFLGFSNRFLCRGNKTFSLLSEYVFEIYLEDFYIFLNDIFLKYNQNFFFVYPTFPLFFSPSKFLKINERFNLKETFILNYRNFSKKSYTFSKFKRCIESIKYKYHFLIFFYGSKNFSLFVKKKIFSFVKSSLHFDIIESARRFFYKYKKFCLKKFLYNSFFYDRKKKSCSEIFIFVLTYFIMKINFLMCNL